MKAKTAYQKIIDTHCVRVLDDGSLVLKVDRSWCHEITFPPAIIDAKNRGCDVVFNPNGVKTMIDHVSPAKDTDSAIQGKMIRDWSKEHDVEFLDVGRNGVCHAIIPEKGWIRPGEVGVMGDSHTCTHGAFCALAAGVGTTELEGSVITGLWVCPPQKVIRVNFVGRLPANIFAKDLVLSLIKKIGVGGATNAILEFGGPVIDEMSMEGRMTITNMAVEAGATSGMMMVDQTTLDYLGSVYKRMIHENLEIGNHSMAEQWNSDPGAEYDKVIEICVTDMVPVVTNNYSPGDVVNVRELRGKKVNQVYIGSCTNGRIEDLRIAASIFHLIGEKIHPDVRCIVNPATQHIWNMALQEGLFKTFVEAGCHVSGPSCGACLGMSCGVIAPGEVCVSTTNRNFRGRMGEGGMVHLASPATAAVTAIYGVISEPSVDLCREVEFEIDQAGPKNPATDFTDWGNVFSPPPDYGKLLEGLKIGDVKNFSGKPFYLPLKNVDTDQIIPARYLNETDKTKFGEHCLEDAPMSDEMRSKIQGSQIIISRENFGCGSSREHAPWALEGAGIRCAIAPVLFARIFKASMFANGLLCIVLPEDVVESLLAQNPSDIRIDWENGDIQWLNGPEKQSAKFSLSFFQKELIENKGYINFIIKCAAELQKEGKLS